jgi:hypothetical protein
MRIVPRYGGYPEAYFHKCEEEEVTQGGWKVLDPGEVTSRVIIGCPRCGAPSTIAYLQDERMMGHGHHVGSEGKEYRTGRGEVWPSRICPSCREHYWVNLEDWDPTPAKQAPFTVGKYGRKRPPVPL